MESISRCFFFNKTSKRASKRSRSKICLNHINKSVELCYSVDEADSRFITDFAFVLTTGANRQNILMNQGFNVGRGYIVPYSQEISANMYSDGKVDLIGVSGVCLRDDYVRGNHFREVIHDHPCKNLLNNVLLLLRVKVGKPDGIF